MDNGIWLRLKNRKLEDIVQIEGLRGKAQTRNSKWFWTSLEGEGGGSLKHLTLLSKNYLVFASSLLTVLYISCNQFWAITILSICVCGAALLSIISEVKHLLSFFIPRIITQEYYPNFVIHFTQVFWCRYAKFLKIVNTYLLN